MRSGNRVLFLFTKEFPYGNLEHYLAEEIPYLSENFQKIVILPCELFDQKNKAKRNLPDNFVVLNINLEIENIHLSVKRYGKGGILVSEFLNEKDKWRFLKEFPRYWSILKHQCKLASFMEGYLTRFKDQNLYFYSYWLHNSAILLGLLKKNNKIHNFIARAHSIDLYHNDWPFAYAAGVKVLPFQYFKTRMVSAVFSISAAGEGYLKNKYPQMKDKFFTAYLGVRDRGKGKWNKDDPFTLVSCSAMNIHKRVPLIAAAFLELDFPARWFHFGDGSEMEKTRTIVSSISPHLSVELRGYTPNEQIMDFYQNNTVHLFINLSSVEGIPVSLMEASSFGIPLIATNVNGNAEIVNNHTGFLIPEEFQVEEVARIIKQLAKDISLQKELRVTAREFCLLEFSEEKNFTRFVSEILKYKN